MPVTLNFSKASLAVILIGENQRVNTPLVRSGNTEVTYPGDPLSVKTHLHRECSIWQGIGRLLRAKERCRDLVHLLLLNLYHMAAQSEIKIARSA